ncbi:hypothetical protein GHT06_020117 [Daphnia sinensis]|uniref:C2H2-type domain-containing protein n=1 Tax=Daphnia sinensis TaxID=1820382 RepID=A0AAD5L3Z1_9CRUS|nr:hypothetical protein GHT06_020117 [Daphnia sinensis]
MLDVNDKAESKQLEDEKFQLEDGRTYPIFTQCGTDKDQINCNICDLLIPSNTRDALKHAVSLGHQHRLHDVKLATTTLLRCVKKYGLVILANDSVSVDEDETPPGCEELRSWSHSTPKISSCLKSHCKSAFIGLEYVVEVNPDRGMSCTSHSFYICILCEKRCENLDNILKHIQSSAHRILYLKKYFPRAHSLFLQADPRVENWPPKIHEYLETIASRIETINGRLQILSCHRTQWEVKSQLFRTKIDLGIHFRETPDLLYDDIGSPFTETISGECAKDGKPEFSIAQRLGSGLTDNAEMEKADKRTLSTDKGFAAIAIDEAITLSSDESVFETDGETCEKRIGVAVLRVPSRTGSCRTRWCEKTKPLNVQKQSISGDKHESSAKIPVCQSAECDEVVIVEEEIVQKDVEPVSKARYRVVPFSESRRRSRSPERLRSECSSRSRDTVSRSRSPSPKRLRSSHSSSERSQSSQWRNADMQQSSMSDARSEYDKKRHENLVRRCDRNRQTPEKQRKENKNNNKKNAGTKTTNEIRLMEKVEQKLNAFKEALSRKQQIYKKRPQNHPLYTVEWEIFWKRRFSEIEKQGKNPYMHDFKPEWFKFWFKRMKRIDKKEIEAKKTELMRKYRLTDEETGQDNTLKGKASDSHSEGQRRLQFGWKKISNETKSTPDLKNGMDSERSKIKNLPPNLQQPIKKPAVVDHSLESSSFEELRILHKSKDISVVSGNTSHSANDWKSSDPTLLQVLRMLVALEDSLGSLGPSITKLLTRALSAERCRAGSSSQLLQENATFVVDLLDTSKEKLKGLVCAGILEGVKASAASQAIKSVTRFLEQSVPILNSGQTTNGPPSFDIASLINNLREAGLLHPIPSDTVIPTTLSDVQTSKIDKPEEITSSYSSEFIVGAPSLLQEDTGSSQEDKSQFGSFDQFTGEEIKILIVNFRTLTASQKRDLIHCLRHVEERYAEKNSMHQSQSVSSTSISPSSPLPKKHRTNDKPIHPYSSEVRYPSILKLTGLSSVDLENYGIPLKQLEPILPSENQNFTKKPEEQVASTNPRPPLVKSVHQQSRIGQSHQWTLSEGGSGTLARLSMETLYTRKDGNDWNELIVDQPILCTFDRREDGSFCNVLLDPRRNRACQVKQPLALVPELPHSIGRYNDPIIIPTSPVSSRRSQRNGMRHSLSDSRPSSCSSETANPLPETGNRYW